MTLDLTREPGEFVITWALPDDEWRKAISARRRHPPGSYYDHILGPCTDLLYGQVQMPNNGTPLFPLAQVRALSDGHRAFLQDQGVDLPPDPGDDELLRGEFVSVIDLAYQLAGMLMARFGGAPDGLRTRFSHSDAPWGVWFEKAGGRVEIRPSFDPGVGLSVHRGEFVGGVEDFLAAFAAEVERRAPALLDWDTFAPLRPYLPRTPRRRGRPARPVAPRRGRTR